jgi:hypothetical protein
MGLFDSVRNSVRKALGLRKERAVPRPGPKPRLGAKIVKDDVRITVQAGLNDSTWKWLVELGWREEMFRNSRRAYREVPPSRVAELFDAADPDERQQLLQLAVEEATYRPVFNLERR